jgi:hypothetical protein
MLSVEERTKIANKYIRRHFGFEEPLVWSGANGGNRVAFFESSVGKVHRKYVAVVNHNKGGMNIFRLARCVSIG